MADSTGLVQSFKVSSNSVGGIIDIMSSGNTDQDVAAWASVISTGLFIISELMAFSNCSSNGVCQWLLVTSRRILRIKTVADIPAVVAEEITDTANLIEHARGTTETNK